MIVNKLDIDCLGFPKKLIVSFITLTENERLPLGMPKYIASGSHYYQNARYRFLILHRYKCDLHSIIKNHSVSPKYVLIIASQIIDILEHFHDKGYAHSDIKAENLMVGQCKYDKRLKINDYKVADEKYRHYKNSPVKLTPTLATPEAATSVISCTTPNARLNKSRNVEFSGTQPIRSCRSGRKTSTYEEMLETHYSRSLRPSKKVNYNEELYFERVLHKIGTLPDPIHTNKRRNDSDDDSEEDEEVDDENNPNMIEEDRLFLIDFGLASKFIDSNGQHRPFCMDQRRAHDGTLEFTSRDAHMGAHSRRSDLECLGYNLIYWSQGKFLLDFPLYFNAHANFFLTLKILQFEFVGFQKL